MTSPTIRAAYSMWPHYNRAIRDAVAGLTEEQLATSPANGHWPLWAIVGHLACQRVFWLCDFAGVPRDADTPFPDAPFNCPGDDDLDNVLSGAQLADALDRTFVIVERALDTWMVDHLGDELRRPEWGDDWVHTRAAVVQRVLAHDVSPRRRRRRRSSPWGSRRSISGPEPPRPMPAPTRGSPTPPPPPSDDAPMTDDLARLDAPVRALFERIAAPAALATPDLDAIGRALVDLAADIDWATPWITRLGERNGMEAIHAPARGPRLLLVHRPEGVMSAVHDHGTWVAATAVTGTETHRRWRRLAGDAIELAQVDHLEPLRFATLLPPDDVHDHGHLLGHGRPAHTLILLGDNQQAFTRNEWDPATGRRRTLHPGEGGRWVATEPWPTAAQRGDPGEA